MGSHVLTKLCIVDKCGMGSHVLTNLYIVDKCGMGSHVLTNLYIAFVDVCSESVEIFNCVSYEQCFSE